MAALPGPGGGPERRPPRIYLGAGSAGPAWASEEQSVMVLGPPRSGKTSGLVVPTVLAATGAAVAVSTKDDVLEATASWRSRRGPCLLFDPSGTVPAPPGVQMVTWSPVPACRQWDEAMLVANAMVGASRPAGAGQGALTNASHWDERAQALLSTLMHAGALGDEQLPTVLRWVDRRQAAPALGILDAHGADVAGDLLSGIAATDAKEQSGIWSTASGVLAGYRSSAALRSTIDPEFDAAAFCDSSSTLYICATGRHQAMLAPMVVGLLTEIRAAAYAHHARGLGAHGRPTAVVFALDEVANIAPLPDLPAMVSEGGGQGLLTLACLQDLSQARSRWGAAADGFLSLFGTTVVLPGIGDVRTLQALSALAGEEEVVVRSLSAPAATSVSFVQRLVGAMGRGRYGQVPPPPSPTVTTATRRQPRLPVDAVARGMPGMGLLVNERNAVEWVRLTPYFAHEPWRSITEPPTLADGRQPARWVQPGGVEHGGAGWPAGRDPGR
jgi:type IV secretion system protein VirD4